MSAKRKMTKAQAGRLGGLATMRKHSEAELEAQRSKGGSTTFERHGKEHFVRAAYIRHGFNVKPLSEVNRG